MISRFTSPIKSPLNSAWFSSNTPDFLGLPLRLASISVRHTHCRWTCCILTGHRFCTSACFLEAARHCRKSDDTTWVSNSWESDVETKTGSRAVHDGWHPPWINKLNNNITRRTPQVKGVTNPPKPFSQHHLKVRDLARHRCGKFPGHTRYDGSYESYVNCMWNVIYSINIYIYINH